MLVVRSLLPLAAMALQHKYGRETYGATVTRGAADLPPLLLIPPVGVGIDRQFFARFQDAWDGGDTHAPDLLGTGDATPKPRRFYKPEIWAGQLDAYIREVVGEPCVLVSQGGLLPVALEMWRLGGTETISAVACMSPPPLSFVASDGVEADRNSPATPRAPRRIQRIAWAISASTVGNLFFRRLRGKKGERIRTFTDKNLFAGKSDDQWVKQCFESAQDSKGRFATLSYLCGNIPAGGAWRDERGGLLADLSVPTSVIRGDFPGARDPMNRTQEALDTLPRPAGGYVVRNARACLPWEQPENTASALLSFIQCIHPSMLKEDRSVQYVTRASPPVFERAAWSGACYLART